MWSGLLLSVGSLLLTDGAGIADATGDHAIPAAAQPAAAARPFFGVSVPRGDLAALPGIEQAAQAHPSVWSVFVALDSKFDTPALLQISQSGMTPFITFDPWSWRSAATVQPAYSLRSVITGNHDAAIAKLAGIISAGHTPVYLRFAHEMNGWWLPWSESVNGNRPGEYVAAWRHVHDLMNRLAPGLIHWVWAPNLVINHHALTTPLSELYPGDKYVDDLGLTCYGHSGTASSTCGATLTAMQQLSKRPIILSEIGADGAGQAKWIASLAQLFARFPRINGFIYFNTTPATTGASGHYQFTGSGPSESAFRGLLSHLQLAGRVAAVGHTEVLLRPRPR
jgi:beta-mannanase